MKKTLLFTCLALALVASAFSQSLYTNTNFEGNLWNPGLGSANTPVIVLDDVLIPSASVQGTDSIDITMLKFGIGRFANAPAVTINFYYTILDDTATMIDNAIKVPPIPLGSIDLPANGDANVATVIALGDSVNTLFRVKTDTGNVFAGYQTIFIGLSISNDPNAGNNWLLATPGAPENDNQDVMWIYDVDDVQTRYATAFGGTNPPSASFYLQVFGKGLGTLPVTLVDFNARRSGRVNLLTWNTQQELNTRNFAVERSTDGRNFVPISLVPASGNSSTVRHYNYTDEQPVKGINYYRLRTHDKDNTSRLSPTRSVRNEGLADLSIYPNPVADKLAIAINADDAVNGFITITDLGGKAVYAAPVRLPKGSTLLPVSTSNFAAGSYILKLQLNDDVIVKKFNKR